MALVTVVYVPTPDRRAPDLNRIGRIEDIDRDVARRMVEEGTARWPSEDDFARQRALVAADAAECDAIDAAAEPTEHAEPRRVRRGKDAADAEPTVET